MDTCYFRYSSTENDFNFSHNISDPPNPNSYSVHIHNLYELYYFISGDVTYYIEGQAYNIKNNDILVINNRELHRPVFNSPSPYERITIHFKSEFISSFQSKEYNLLHCFEKRKLGQNNKFDASDSIKFGIDKYFKQLEEYIKENSPERHIMIKTIFIQMLAALNKTFVHKNNILINSYESDKKISSILDYINVHLDEKITLDVLEQKFFVNKYYLCHIFKKSTGFTVMEYITYKRIMKVKEFLLRGMPAIEACHAVGFLDYSNFYKIFKRLVGISPKQFIKKIP